MQLRHRRAEQRLGLGLNRLVEPGIQRSGELASYDNRRIKLNSRVAAKSFKEDGRRRAAKSLLDRGERLVIELDRTTLLIIDVEQRLLPTSSSTPPKRRRSAQERHIGQLLYLADD